VALPTFGTYRPVVVMNDVIEAHLDQDSWERGQGMHTQVTAKTLFMMMNHTTKTTGGLDRSGLRDTLACAETNQGYLKFHDISFSPTARLIICDLF
jgi:hypothetical protein